MVKKYVYGSLAVLLLSAYETKAADTPINSESIDSQIKINQRHLMLQNKEIERSEPDHEQNLTHISDLSDKILVKIFTFLPKNELRAALETCKKFAAITQEIGKKYSLTFNIRSGDKIPPQYFGQTIYIYNSDLLPENNNRDNLKEFHHNNKDQISSIVLKTEIINEIPTLTISPGKLALTGYMSQQLILELPFYSRTIPLKLKHNSTGIANISLEFSVVEDAMLGGSYMVGMNKIKYS